MISVTFSSGEAGVKSISFVFCLVCNHQVEIKRSALFFVREWTDRQIFSSYIIQHAKLTKIETHAMGVGLSRIFCLSNFLDIKKVKL